MNDEEFHSNLRGSKFPGNYKESEFMDLDDLVYAPLEALAKSNHQLRASVIEAIKSMEPYDKTVRMSVFT